MKLKQLPRSFSIISHQRSYLFVVDEVSKLIENLEAGMDDFKTTLINQTAYFYLINRNEFPYQLMNKWLLILEQVGLKNIAYMHSVEDMKVNVFNSTKNYTEEDIGSLMINLYDLKSMIWLEIRK